MEYQAVHSRQKLYLVDLDILASLVLLTPRPYLELSPSPCTRRGLP